MAGMPSPARSPRLRPFARLPSNQGASGPLVLTDSLVGEALFESPRYFNSGSVFNVSPFRVPRGVHRISVLGIAPGTAAYNDGTSAYNGYPGALGYLNDIAVTPGELLTVYVNSPSSGFGGNTRVFIQNSGGRVIFDLRRTADPSDNALNAVNRGGSYGYGAPGYRGPSTNSTTPMPGSGAACIYGGVAPYGIGNDGNVSQYGHYNGSQNDPSWPVYGGMGIGTGGDAGNAMGCIRIIWGPGRNFPFNARKISK